MVDKGDEVRAPDELCKLLAHITVVDVHRNSPQLEGREHRLQELDAVVKVQADVVASSDAGPGEAVGQSGRPEVQVPVRQAVLAAHQRLAVGNGVGNALEEVC